MLDEDESSEELFEKYLSPVGKILDDGREFRAIITFVDSDKLFAKAKVLSTYKSNYWFEIDEEVMIEHVGNEIWRMTSDDNNHGQAVFLGDLYDGFGIGS